MAEFGDQDTKGFVTIHKMEDGTYHVVTAGLTREERYFAVMAAYHHERVAMTALAMPEPEKGPPAVPTDPA
jgi:hypothetical protein